MQALLLESHNWNVEQLCKMQMYSYCLLYCEKRISISPPLLSHRTRKQQRPVGSRDERDAMGGNRIATNHRGELMRLL